MLGGSFFPFEIMPAWLARIGRFTPNGWALEQLKAVLRDAVEPVQLALALVGVVLVGALAFLISMRRLRRAFAQA
jgi:ABC-type multidrug transport system permease subunit